MKITVSWTAPTGGPVEASFITEAAATECASVQSVGGNAMVVYDDDVCVTTSVYQCGVEVETSTMPKVHDLGAGWCGIRNHDGSVNISKGAENIGLSPAQVETLKCLMKVMK